MSSANKKTGLLVLWLALLGGLFFAITHVNNMGAPSLAPSAPPPPPKFSAADLSKQWPAILAHAAPPRGPANAPYTLAEFGDFQCPQCGKVRPVIEGLLKQSPASVNLVFVHCPIPSLHHWALPAAEASQAAAAQGKFWPMYDALYSHQDDLEPGYYAGYATGAGLDTKAFQAAMASHQYWTQVAQIAQFTASLGVDTTPTVLLHDNRTDKVTIYIGSDSSLPGGPPGYPGIKQLAAAPPWLAAPKTARNGVNP